MNDWTCFFFAYLKWLVWSKLRRIRVRFFLRAIIKALMSKSSRNLIMNNLIMHTWQSLFSPTQGSPSTVICTCVYTISYLCKRTSYQIAIIILFKVVDAYFLFFSDCSRSTQIIVLGVCGLLNFIVIKCVESC